MIITNKFNLPEVYVRAVVNDGYDSGGSDFTATSLETPPRAYALMAQFKDQLEVDASSRVASIIGQGMHHIAERAARPGLDLCEKRLFASIEVDGVVYKISAQLDLFETDTGALYDWKSTKSYAFHKKAGGGKKPEWISQLNVGAWILKHNSYEAKSLTIIALLKDWNKREAGSTGYPISEVIAVPLPLWTFDETSKYIENRIRLLVAAKKELPKCSAKDAWGGNRCAQYCDASSVCEQWKKALSMGLME